MAPPLPPPIAVATALAARRRVRLAVAAGRAAACRPRARRGRPPTPTRRRRPSGPTPRPSFVRADADARADVRRLHRRPRRHADLDRATAYGTTARSIAFWNRRDLPEPRPGVAGLPTEPARGRLDAPVIPNIQFDEQTLPEPSELPGRRRRRRRRRTTRSSTRTRRHRAEAARSATVASAAGEVDEELRRPELRRVGGSPVTVTTTSRPRRSSRTSQSVRS